MVVIGGGIHGAGVAQAAAADGHRVLMLEKNALGSGTSSRSSKLIHGGLRYLERGHVRLVWESLRERQLLFSIAPDLVRLAHFYLPVYRHTRRKDWQLITGLSLYAVLAGFTRGTGFRRYGPEMAGSLDDLCTDGLRAVYRYSDGRTDDRELTRAITASAVSLGARLRVPAEFLGADLRQKGCVVRYRQDDREDEVWCRTLVNAAGPWIDRVLTRITPAPRRVPMALVQGAHVIVPDHAIQHCYYVENPRDGRAIFVLPYKGGTMVGTTETRFAGDPDTVSPRPSEVRYLWSVLLRHFPQFGRVDRSSLKSWAGLRVLPAGPGHAFHLSRETRLITDRRSHPRLLTIYGGKLTGYRATARKVMSRLGASLPAPRPRADTRKLILEPVPEDWPQ